jgi:CRP-like cAMP-binding protein
MRIGELGRIYQDRECIVRQGEAGRSMYVVQAGKVEVIIVQKMSYRIQDFTTR